MLLSREYSLNDVHMFPQNSQRDQFQVDQIFLQGWNNWPHFSLVWAMMNEHHTPDNTRFLSGCADTSHTGEVLGDSYTPQQLQWLLNTSQPPSCAFRLTNVSTTREWKPFFSGQSLGNNLHLNKTNLAVTIWENWLLKICKVTGKPFGSRKGWNIHTLQISGLAQFLGH